MWVTVILVFVTALLTQGYVLSSPDPYPWRTSFLRALPSSMLQNIIPLEQEKDLIQVINYAKLILKEEPGVYHNHQHTLYMHILLNDLGSYGLSNYGTAHEINLSAAVEFWKDRTNRIYAIWWSPGYGWYGEGVEKYGFEAI